MPLGEITDLSALEDRADSLIDAHDHLLEALRKLRAKHHLSQAQVAERMGVSQPTVAAFERYDANPTLSTIRRYALAVGARIEEIVSDDCHPNTNQQFEEIVLESFGQDFASKPQTFWVQA